MTDLFAARSQMAMSLGFHIVFAAIGIALPLLMVIAESLWLRSREPVYLELAHRWAKGAAIMFAVGAVSGTVLSFELGLLWPTFMEHAGAVIGMPFSLEGFAFFLEAIFLGIYLYGWRRVSEGVHLFCGVMVMISGTLSGIFVVTANAWMNTPVGFELVDGKFTQIEPFVAMFNPAAFTQCLHMTLASFAAVGFGVAGVHAALLLRDPEHHFHRRALGIAMSVAIPFALAMPLSGDLSAKYVAEYQPAKFAAMEGHFETAASADFHIGGWPDEEARRTIGSLELPGLLSFLAHGDFDAVVVGLEEFPTDEWPPVAVVHFGFQIMVGAGLLMIAVGGLFGIMWLRNRRKLPTDRWLLRAIVLASPLGFIAIEAGWTVTEVGRQPWIIYGIMRTSDAVTPMPHLVVPFTVFTVGYVVLAIAVVKLMKRQVFLVPDEFAREGTDAE